MIRKTTLSIVLAVVSLASWADGYQFDISMGRLWLKTNDFPFGNEVGNYGAERSGGALVDLDGDGRTIDVSLIVPLEVSHPSALRLGYEYWKIEGGTTDLLRDYTWGGNYFCMLPIDPDSPHTITYFNSIDDGEFAYWTSNHSLTLYLMDSTQGGFFDELSWGYGLVFGHYRNTMGLFLAGIDVEEDVFEFDWIEMEATKIGIGGMFDIRKELPLGFSLTCGAEARLCLGWQDVDAFQEQAGSYDEEPDATTTAHDHSDAVFMPELIAKAGIERPIGKGFVLFVKGDVRYLGNMPELQMPQGTPDERVSGFGLKSTSFWGYRVMGGLRKEF